MDEAHKKTALRMIPYGLYILTGKHEDQITAATVNWVTQTAFEPPLVVVGVKTDASAHGIIKSSGSFVLNMLGKGQQDLAFTFFKPAEVDGNSVSGNTFTLGSTGAPVLDAVPAFLECKLTDTLEKGDHSVFLGEVVDAGVRTEPEARADDAILVMKDLGEKVFYGG